MKLAAIFSFLLFFLFPPYIYSAEVRNVTAKQVGNRMLFEYDLMGDEQETEVNVTIMIKGQSYPMDKLHLEGDFGKVKTGKGKKIWWNVLQDFPRGVSGDVEWEVIAEFGKKFKDRFDLAIKGNYWAFIIGINEYIYLPPEKHLEAARPDAQALARLLKEKYGFRVVELYDRGATRKNIHTNLRTFSKQLGENDNLLIYFAGHGEYEKETHLGGWLPSDAKPDDVTTYFSNEEIRAYIKSIKAKHIYTIADSCFSQALMGTKTRSLRESSVNELYNDKSRWVLTSGGYYPVPDRRKGNHSIFAYYLIRILEKNEERYLPVDKLYSSLRDAVSNETTQQTPRSAPIVEAGDEGGQFIFVYASGR